MRKRIPFLILLILCGFFFGGKESAQGPTEKEELYGGVFRVNITEDFRSLYPLNIVELSGRDIAGQVYEGLVRYDPSTLLIEPALAQSWSLNDSANKITFNLRTNIYFHDDYCFPDKKGRKLNARDIKFCLDKACQSSADNQLSYSFLEIVKGAKTYYEKSQKGILMPYGVPGFRVINDSTFAIDLLTPRNDLLPILTGPAGWIYPKEAFDKYGPLMRTQCVGTGPFFVRQIKEGETVILYRNPNYWRKDRNDQQLPFLDAIQFSFVDDKDDELFSFLTEQLDLITGMKQEAVTKLQQGKYADNFILLTDTMLSFTYYGFQNQSVPFTDVRVRKAFCLAIDRKEIAESILKGDVIAAGPGYIPPGIPGYKNTDAGFEFDPAKAKKLLAEAGYPNGKKFPVLKISINAGGGNRNTDVANAIAVMLKNNLGISTEIETKPFAQHLEEMETGKNLFFRTGWIIDYADPLPFLAIAYGKDVPASFNERSSLNPCRFKNPDFDSPYEKAVKEKNTKLRMEFCMHAEKAAIENAAFLPLYYEKQNQLLSTAFEGYQMNGLRWLDLSEVRKVK